MPTSENSMKSIGDKQRLERNLRRQLAARAYYRAAKRLHAAGATIAILLAAASPFVLLFKPRLGPLLGAIAGGWIFLSRLLLEPMKMQLQAKGAAA
jgi:hypothetical protein